MMDLIWYSRNDFTHGGAAPAPTLLCCRILKTYFDSVSSLSKPSPSVTSWIPLPSDWLKFSVDAAIGEEVSMIASVVRDYTSNIVFWHFERIQSTDPLFVEVMAMLSAISSASRSFSSSYCWFEGDAKVVIDSFLSLDTILYWPIAAIVDNSVFLLKKLPI